MGRLVIILAFSLGALLMLESVQATKDCKIYIFTMKKRGIPNNEVRIRWYTVRGSHQPSLQILKKKFPQNEVQIAQVLHFHAKNCKVVLDAVEKRLKEVEGSLWLKALPSRGVHEDLAHFYSIISPVIGTYSMPKKLPINIAMAEADNDYDDENMIDGENSRIHLQELLLRLLD